MTGFHTACRTIDWQPAWRTWEEGCELFRRLAGAGGEWLLALCVMPDHVHISTSQPARDPIRHALSGYTRWRNHRLGRTGPLWMPVPEPSARSGDKKLRRDQRYIELNPCRAGLVADPLEWPLSTFRDRMGLAWPAVRDRAHDPVRWHAYVTRDDDVSAAALPYAIGVRSPQDVEEAVSAVVRVPLPQLRSRGPARTLLTASLRSLTDLRTGQIARLVGVTPAAVRAVAPAPDALQIVARVAGDARFRALGVRELCWRDYRSRPR